MTINKIFNLTSRRRSSIRNELVQEFLKEAQGRGKEELASRYVYTVESIGGYAVELHRPAPLNKGFDFIVRIKGMCFKKIRRHTNPSHNDIIMALKQVINEPWYNLVKEDIISCYLYSETKNLGALSGKEFLDGDSINRPISLIILSIKWLFIEQDVTYWNWSGRRQLFKLLASHGLI